MNADPYYLRSEVSNSDLSAVKEMLSPSHIVCDRERIFYLGSLVDAVITEPARVDFLNATLDGEPVSPADWTWAMRMRKALHREARIDPFLAKVLEYSDTQKCSYRTAQPFELDGFTFHLDTRCKWDWWLPQCHFGGDLKTTSASTEAEFLNAIDAFDWDRSRAWYMDIENTDCDFIYAISKKTFKVFKVRITRDSEIYKRGRAKYLDLAFKYYCYVL